jgi:hypothetical protein
MPAPAPVAENGAPRTELQELQFKSGQVTDESLESTRRMIALCEEVIIELYLSRSVKTFNKFLMIPL